MTVTEPEIISVEMIDGKPSAAGILPESYYI
jgi:hypothetical protein